MRLKSVKIIFKPFICMICVNEQIH